MRMLGLSNRCMKDNKPSTIFCYLSDTDSLCIGDSIIHLPFLRSLKSWATEAEIVIYPRKGGVELLEPLFEPWVSKSLYLLPDDSSNKKYDLVFDLVGASIKKALSIRRLAKKHFFSTAARGWVNFPLIPIYHVKHTLRRHLRLLRQASGHTMTNFWPWPLPKEYVFYAEKLLPDGPLYIGIAPGAGDLSTKKNWPISHYVELASRIVDLGYVPVIFLGPNEKGWEINFTKIPSALFPKTESDIEHHLSYGPLKLIALGGRLSVAVTNCCGSGHMFALSGTPLVSLFGPTNHEKLAPFCRRSVCVLPANGKSRNTEFITIDDVLAGIHWAVGLDPWLDSLESQSLRRLSFPEIGMNT